MHILLIGNSIDPKNGYGTMAHTHCAAFFNKGIPFTIILPRSAERVSVPYGRHVRYILPDLPLSFSSFSGIIRMVRLFVRIPLIGITPTAVHSLVDFPYVMLGYRIARTRNLPFFFSALGTYSVVPFMRRIDRLLFMFVYRAANGIFAISSFTAEAMQVAARHKRPIEIVYLPVEMPVRPALTSSFFTQLPQGARILLSVSAFKERKGMEVIIKAMSSIVQNVPQAHLVIVATGNALPSRLLAEKYGVKDHIHFIRNISADGLFSLFEQSSVFALTPCYADHYFEGYGLVYIEAGWHKKPVVGTLSGGVPEAVTHNVTGLLVPENDEKETARALITVLTDSALARRLGEGGYALARSRTASAYADLLIRSYKAHERK